MKKTPLKRKTPLKAKKGFTPNTSPKTHEGTKVERLGSYTIVSSSKRFSTLKRSNLRSVGISDTANLKKEIQALIRAIVILRDGGCFLRNYTSQINPQYVKCGAYRKDGDLVLQAEHLHTRGSANSFSNEDIIVCVCSRHHLYYKPQYSAEYNELAGNFIGAKRKKIWDIVRQDRTSHKVDLKLEKIRLEQILKKLLKTTKNTNNQDNIQNVVDKIYKDYGYLLK